MTVQVKFASLKGIKPHEWAVRFFFGGAICVAAGLISKHFGPGFGGLFLAFPAIFPASASLVESHEKTHKARAGCNGTRRGRVVAGVDAAGTAMGCFGLVAFALTIWLGLNRLRVWQVFMLATALWLGTALLVWFARKSRVGRRFGRRPRTYEVFHAS